MKFNELGLCPELLRVVEELGYEEPTPVQAKAIPPILEGRDMVGSAQTGTGKTAAFALPTLHRLANPGKCRALALAPTRELAIQIEENFRTYGKYMRLKMALLYGGVKYGKQLDQLRNNPDIVVATPGRLLDHIGQRNLDLRNIETLILDEVDRMLDMGFIEGVTKIIQKTPRSRQTLLFSATIPDSVRRLADWALDDPAEAQIDIKISAADTVSHALYPVPAIQKFDLLIALLNKVKFENLIIFFQTRRGTDKISRWLSEHGQGVGSFIPTSSKETGRPPCRTLKMGRSKSCLQPMSPRADWISQTSRTSSTTTSPSIPRITFTGSGEPDEPERKGKPSLFASRKNSPWCNRSKNFWEANCRENSWTILLIGILPSNSPKQPQSFPKSVTEDSASRSPSAHAGAGSDKLRLPASLDKKNQRIAGP